MRVSRFVLFYLSQGTWGLRLAGGPNASAFASDVAAGADVNGDAVGDLLVGAPQLGTDRPGRAYLVFGARSRPPAALLTVAGLAAAPGALTELLGAAGGDQAGRCVAFAGDLNGDGVADVAVCAPGDSRPHVPAVTPPCTGPARVPRGPRSAVYVVWGRRGAWPPSLNLSRVGSDDVPGIVIRGALGDGLGASVHAAGDVDGDGIDDLVVGAAEWTRPPHESTALGRAYVVYGRKQWLQRPVPVAALATDQGFAVEGSADWQMLGSGVSSGDFDGDNRTDVVAGTASVRSDVTPAYVAYGAHAHADVEAQGIANASAAGFAATYDKRGVQLELLCAAGVGDLNGDGADDLAVGAHVLFGRRGERMSGAVAADGVAAPRGFALRDGDVERRRSCAARAGDLNGDRVDDLALAARTNASSAVAHVLFGRAAATAGAWPSVVDVGAGGSAGCSAGYALVGSSAVRGDPVVVAGDVNGDGVPDIVLALAGTDANGGGEVHVVYGVSQPVVTAANVTVARGNRTVLSGQQLAVRADSPRAEVLVHVASVAHGHFALAPSHNTSVEQFTMQDVDEGRVEFVHDGSVVAPSFTVAVSALRAGCRQSAPVAATVALVESSTPVHSSSSSGRPAPVTASSSSRGAPAGSSSGSEHGGTTPSSVAAPVSSSSAEETRGGSSGSEPPRGSSGRGVRASSSIASGSSGYGAAARGTGGPNAAAIAVPICVFFLLLVIAVCVALYVIARRRQRATADPLDPLFCIDRGRAKEGQQQHLCESCPVSIALSQLSNSLSDEPRHIALCAALPAGERPVSERRALAGKELAEFERSFRQYYQMHHEDYTATRIRQGKLPLVFVVTAAWEVRNPVLEAWYEARRRYMGDELRRTGEELEERVAFHGTMERNVGPICDLGLLRVGHPLNPSHSTDTGFFGDPRRGVYASRFVEYTLQYSNCRVASDGHEFPCPVSEGDSVKIVMFKALPGLSLHMKSVAVAVPPTAGYDSHSSPQWAEWFFFDETQLCPTHVVEVLAITNRRTEANEGL
eukprot:m51a1_g10029 hypothetical protein (1030) ;mRNA; f:111384-114796